MSATEELRRLLDERGVEWSDYSDKYVLHTSWNDLKCWFNEFPDGFTGWGMSGIGTPEQAIAATLGVGECEMEPSFTVPRRLDFMQEYCCSECGEYAYLQIATDDDVLRFCPNCGRKVER